MAARTHGTLVKWNDARGFGFIEPAGGGAELFVHVSAFPKDGQRPVIGELLAFEIEQGANGKRRAARVARPARGTGTNAREYPTYRRHSRHRRWKGIAAALVLAALLAQALPWLRTAPPDSPARQAAPAPAAGHPDPSVSFLDETPAQTFRCDGRTHCSQMTSCEEARYFLRHCPDTQMDGDSDGEPCEAQWCNQEAFR